MRKGRSWEKSFKICSKSKGSSIGRGDQGQQPGHRAVEQNTETDIATIHASQEKQGVGRMGDLFENYNESVNEAVRGTPKGIWDGKEQPEHQAGPTCIQGRGQGAGQKEIRSLRQEE